MSNLDDLGFVPAGTAPAPVQAQGLGDLGFVPDQAPAPAQDNTVLQEMQASGAMPAARQPDASPYPGIPKGAFIAPVRMANTMLGTGAGAAIGAPGGFIGMGIGAGIGNGVAQWSNKMMGLQPQIYPGQIVSSAMLGPGGASGAPALDAITMGKAALQNVAAGTAQTVIDEGRAPTKGELAIMALGGAGGGAAGVAADSGAGAAEVATQKSLNADRDAAVQKLKAAGFVLAPSDVSKLNPGLINSTLESIGTKAGVGAEQSLRNQDPLNNLGRRILGVSKDTQLTPEVFSSAKANASIPYNNLAALSPNAASDLAALNVARKAANELPKSKLDLPVLQAAFQTVAGSPEAQGTLAEQIAQKNAQAMADHLETKMDTHARAYDNWVQAGKPPGSADSDWFQAEADQAKDPTPGGMVQQLRAARVKYAQISELQRGFKSEQNNIDAQVIGANSNKDPGLYTGDLKTIAQYGTYFKPVAREASKVRSPNVSGVRPIAAAVVAGGLGHEGGIAPAMAGAGLLYSPDMARAAVLSRFYQNHFVNPTYPSAPLDASGTIARMAAMRASQPDPQTLQALAQPGQ